MEQETFGGVVVLSEEKYKELEEKGEIASNKLYTNSQFINTPTKMSQLENDVISVVNKLDSTSQTSALSAYQGKRLKDDIEEIRQIASGKTQSFTIQNLAELSELFDIDIFDIEDSYYVNKSEINYKNNLYELHNGDTFLIVDIDVPDYWYSKDEKALYKLESNKIEIGETTQINIDSELSNISENPVQNKVISAALNGKAENRVATESYDGLMSFQDKNKLNAIGEIVELDIQDVEVKDGENTDVGSMKLSPGKWIINGWVSFQANAVGYRKFSYVRIRACETGVTSFNYCDLIDVSKEFVNTYYAQQNSGSNLLINGKIAAIKIA